jgi:hypothetical protein
MTVTTTQTMLANVVHGQASGNYDGSSQLFYSDAVPAANYYAGNGNIQTLFYNLSGFVGIITVQATLNDLPEQAQWFDISERSDGVTPDSGLTSSTVTGNFSWVRARVSNFDGGTIISVTEVYQ